MIDNYWNNKGTYQAWLPLLQALVPADGKIRGEENRWLERFRVASNYYYDLYNNGLCNYETAFDLYFDVESGNYRDEDTGRFSARLFELAEIKMDSFVNNAYFEQKKLGKIN